MNPPANWRKLDQTRWDAVVARNFYRVPDPLRPDDCVLDLNCDDGCFAYVARMKGARQVYAVSADYETARVNLEPLGIVVGRADSTIADQIANVVRRSARGKIRLLKLCGGQDQLEAVNVAQVDGLVVEAAAEATESIATELQKKGYVVIIMDGIRDNSAVFAYARPSAAEYASRVISCDCVRNFLWRQT